MLEDLNREKLLPTGGQQAEGEGNRFHVHLVEHDVFTGKFFLGGAVLFSLIGVWFIYAVTFTDLSKEWVPFAQETAQLLVPEAPDGQEPVELLELSHSLTEDRISIQGKIKNRTAEALDDLMATIALSFMDPQKSVERDVALSPERIEPGSEASFQLEEYFNDRPTGYAVKFKLANGGVVRHKDRRNITVY
jgi:hypothetical protein